MEDAQEQHITPPPQTVIIATDSLETITKPMYLPFLPRNRKAVSMEREGMGKPRRAHTSFIERYDVEDVLRELKVEQEKNEKAKQFILRLRRQKQLHQGRHFLIKQQQDRKKREEMRQQSACLRNKIEEERAKKKMRAEYNIKIVRFREKERMICERRNKEKGKSLMTSKRQLQSRSNSQRIEMDIKSIESLDNSGMPLPKKLTLPPRKLVNQIYLSEEDRKMEAIRKKIYELGKMLQREGIDK